DSKAGTADRRTDWKSTIAQPVRAGNSFSGQAGKEIPVETQSPEVPRPTEPAEPAIERAPKKYQPLTSCAIAAVERVLTVHAEPLPARPRVCAVHHEDAAAFHAGVRARLPVSLAFSARVGRPLPSQNGRKG